MAVSVIPCRISAVMVSARPWFHSCVLVGADAGVHQVEAFPAQHVDGVVHVGAVVVDHGAGVLGQPRGVLQRPLRQVDAGHPRAEPGQRHGVGAEVALQVDAAHLGQVAEPGQVEPDDVGEMPGVVAEDLQVVAAVLGVGHGAVVPVGAVQPQVLGLGRLLGHGRGSYVPCWPGAPGYRGA
jgi:hypothetical protein